jgi:hypothetical protein
MKFATGSSLAALSLAVAAQGRTFTVYNGCPFTIWPAMFTDLVDIASIHVSSESSLLTLTIVRMSAVQSQATLLGRLTALDRDAHVWLI